MRCDGNPTCRSSVSIWGTIRKCSHYINVIHHAFMPLQYRFTTSIQFYVFFALHISNKAVYKKVGTWYKTLLEDVRLSWQCNADEDLFSWQWHHVDADCSTEILEIPTGFILWAKWLKMAPFNIHSQISVWSLTLKVEAVQINKALAWQSTSVHCKEQDAHKRYRLLRNFCLKYFWHFANLANMRKMSAHA
jgi:hypothetical protein